MSYTTNNGYDDKLRILKKLGSYGVIVRQSSHSTMAGHEYVNFDGVVLSVALSENQKKELIDYLSHEKENLVNVSRGLDRVQEEDLIRIGLLGLSGYVRDCIEIGRCIISD